MNKESTRQAIEMIDLSRIRPAPENDQLYRSISPEDPAIVALAKSISARGVLDPLVLTQEFFILSGHRRYAAAKLAGLARVPCIVRLNISREGDPDEFLKLLREHNRQRHKTVDEIAREEIVSINPAETYRELIEHRKRKSFKSDFRPMAIGDAKARKAISPAKAPFLAAIQQVIEARRDFWPLSDRQIHYALLNDPPLTHAGKPASRYRNTLKAYRALVDLLARARVAGLIPFEVIADATRPVLAWQVWQGVTDYLRDEFEELMRGYWRDLMQSQWTHVELVIEKNSVLPILEPVAREYRIPVTSGRGYCSLPPRWELACRFKKSGKSKLVLLLVSDFDPDGEQIAASFARSMRDDFRIAEVEAMKVALTPQQIQQYKIPPAMIAKAGCATRKAFVETHGEHVYELEALPPATLQQVVREAIDRVIDVEAFNDELEAERRDSAKLDVWRRRIRNAIAPNWGDE